VGGGGVGELGAIWGQAVFYPDSCGACSVLFCFFRRTDQIRIVRERSMDFSDSSIRNSINNKTKPKPASSPAEDKKSPVSLQADARWRGLNRGGTKVQLTLANQCGSPGPGEANGPHNPPPPPPPHPLQRPTPPHPPHPPPPPAWTMRTFVSQELRVAVYGETHRAPA